MKRILVNATQQEELRVAVVDGQKLCDLDIETPALKRKKGSIYKGAITSIAHSLNAVFVNYGAARHGFLPFKEISSACLGKNNGGGSVRDLVREGQELIVQIAREERGDKGALLTTFASLVSRYLVLMPNNPRARGVSQRIEGEERDLVRDALRQIERHDDEGVIVRTAGMGRDARLLQGDLEHLRDLWRTICAAAARPAPFLLYQESNIVMQMLRDHVHEDVGEIMIDDAETYNEAREFIKMTAPRAAGKLTHYRDTVPLFSRMQVESQIEKVFERNISLPSGGAIVIDLTEALTTIDVNSARATRRGNIEETALHTNLEAIDEIARQLRLRDLGGLIVIDFIDMTPSANQQRVENRLGEALKEDRARIRLGGISRFGLLEMSRQRLRPSLDDSSQRTCPRCNGHGHIRTVESSALAVLRLMEEEALKEKVRCVVAQVPVEIDSFLLNEKRAAINEIESRHDVKLIIVADIQMETPHYRVTCYREGDPTNKDKSSYELVAAREPRPLHNMPRRRRQEAAAEEAAVSPKIMDEKPPAISFLSTLSRLFKKKSAPAEKSAPAADAQRDESAAKDGARGASSRRGGRRRRSGETPRGQRGGQRSRRDDDRGPRDEQRGRRRGEQRSQRDDADNRRTDERASRSQRADADNRRRGEQRGQRDDDAGNRRTDERASRNRQRPPRGGERRASAERGRRRDDKPRQRDGNVAARNDGQEQTAAPPLAEPRASAPAEQSPPPPHESQASPAAPAAPATPAAPAAPAAPVAAPPKQSATPPGWSDVPESALAKAPSRDARLPVAPSGMTQVETSEKGHTPAE